MDRNHLFAFFGVDFAESLSARRAWIEILCCVGFCLGAKVALRKESVDRNPPMCIIRQMPLTSLSARRAWIEIDFTGSDWVSELSLSARRAWIEIIKFVNLRVVDGSLSARRAWIEIKHIVGTSQVFQSRSPQGERG